MYMYIDCFMYKVYKMKVGNVFAVGNTPLSGKLYNT